MTRAEYKAICHDHRAARRHNGQFDYSDSPAWALAHYGKSAPMPPRAFCASWERFNDRQARRRSLVMVLIRLRRKSTMKNHIGESA